MRKNVSFACKYPIRYRKTKATSKFLASQALLLLVLMGFLSTRADAQLNQDMQTWHVPDPGQNNLWFHENKSSDTVFVFVHGFNSDSRNAWAYTEGGRFLQYWPYLVWNDHRLGHPSVFLGGYSTGPNYHLYDAADELLEGLERQGVLRYKNIVFVAHSLGGIVVRSMLARSWPTNFKGKKIGLLLVASPSMGSYWANFASYYADSTNNYLLKTLKQNDDVLVELDHDFRDLLDSPDVESSHPPQIKVAEIREQYFILCKNCNLELVADEDSASHHYYGKNRVMHGTDHFSIATPRDEDDPSHQFLVDFYLNYGEFFGFRAHTVDLLAGRSDDTTQPVNSAPIVATPNFSPAPNTYPNVAPNPPRNLPLDQTDNRFATIWSTVAQWAKAIEVGDLKTYSSFYANRLDTFYGAKDVASWAAADAVSRSWGEHRQRRLVASRPVFRESGYGGVKLLFCKQLTFSDPQGRQYSETARSFLRFEDISGVWKIVEQCDIGACGSHSFADYAYSDATRQACL
jgi:pimeloyl-ACP methyl ester carboxylesterase